MVRGAAYTNSSNHKAQSLVVRSLFHYVKSSSTKGKAAMGDRETEALQLRESLEASALLIPMIRRSKKP